MEIEIVDASKFYEHEIYCNSCDRLVRYKKLTREEWENFNYVDIYSFRCPDCCKKYEEEILK